MLLRGTIDGTDPSTTVLIKWLKQRPFSYQLYSASWMLQKEGREGMSGFLSNEMCLGKTMTAITYFVLNVLIVHNHEHIRLHPDDHLSDDDDSTTCPYRRRLTRTRRDLVVNWKRTMVTRTSLRMRRTASICPRLVISGYRRRPCRFPLCEAARIQRTPPHP